MDLLKQIVPGLGRTRKQAAVDIAAPNCHRFCFHTDCSVLYCKSSQGAQMSESSVHSTQIIE